MSFSRRGSSTLLSLAIHAVVVAILFLLAGYGPQPHVPVVPEQRVIKLLDPLRNLGHQGSGGGGNHSLTAPSKGQLPPVREFKEPLPVVRSITPPRLLEPAPSLTADVHIDSHMLEFGDPHGVPGPPSSGPGGGGGLGPGDGPGVGPGRGPWQWQWASRTRCGWPRTTYAARPAVESGSRLFRPGPDCQGAGIGGAARGD